MSSQASQSDSGSGCVGTEAMCVSEEGQGFQVAVVKINRRCELGVLSVFGNPLHLVGRELIFK